MATVKKQAPVPVEHEIVLTMTEAEARYVLAALYVVNPSAQAAEQLGTDTDPVYDVLCDALDETGRTIYVVTSGNTPSGTGL